MKKTKLLAPLISIGALTAAVTPIATSCSKGETDPYTRAHTYLEDTQFIKAATNATSYDLRFSLKEALASGQSLKATIAVADGFEKVLSETTYDLSDRVFDKVFYVPVHYHSTYVSATVTTKYSIKIECVSTENGTVWTDTFDNLYIKFTALNAWAGFDYRGYTTDITRMDNFHFTHRMWSGTATAEHDLKQRTMTFPVQLRNSPKVEKNLKATVYDATVYKNGEVRSDIEFGLLSNVKYQGETAYNWVRGEWDVENQYYNYTWEANTNDNIDIRRDETDTLYKTAYDINVGFKRKDGGQMRAADDRVYANFSLLIGEVDSNGDYLWSETFEGCRLTYIDPNDDAQ